MSPGSSPAETALFPTCAETICAVRLNMPEEVESSEGELPAIEGPFYRG
jgi:hypothetical protein